MRGRRVCLLAMLAGTVVLAGCSAGFGGGISPTPTPGTGECEPHDQHVVDPFRESVEPSEMPEAPDRLTESTVEAYVVDVEKAYSRNDALRYESTRVTVSVSSVQVDREGDTWIVELTSQTNTWAAETASGSTTPIVIHGDGALVPVMYRLTDRALYRTEGSVGGTPSATAGPTTPGGRTIVCFDG